MRFRGPDPLSLPFSPNPYYLGCPDTFSRDGARNHEGTFMAGRNHCFSREVSVFKAEVVGVRETFSWIKDLQMQESEVAVESDSQLTVKAILSDNLNLLEAGEVIESSDNRSRVDLVADFQIQREAMNTSCLVFSYSRPLSTYKLSARMFAVTFYVQHSYTSLALNSAANDSTGAADTVHCIRSQSTCKLNARLEPDTETCGIKDTFGTTSLTLSNKEVKQLTGVPLHKILTEMEENEARTQIRAAIKNIIRRVYAFRFKVTSYN
ncbi:hypothetical protein POM88_038538 [Heracleum sosnowskyi]|uniref:RNase H type-1 domain-containing protein n=1 Tax=Heracleum sosnowskyi TaxID=360622 RepID=A0AAD8H844_9APIA|nr:hypothetical protein POM88_038538 [Heracleum sosnowskyi]